MKIPCSILVLFLFAFSAFAQRLPSPSPTPRVTVIQKNWHIDVRNPVVEKDPLQANKDRQQEEIQQRADAKENQNRIDQGMPALPPRIPVRAQDVPHRVFLTYVFEVALRNTGDKKIHTVTWEYVFFEPGTERELGRRLFISRVDLKPGGTRKLIIRSTEPPIRTIDATKAGQNPRDLYSEQVVIQKIGYSDGSVWQSSPN